jgi:hypothetical protein
VYFATEQRKLSVSLCVFVTPLQLPDTEEVRGINWITVRTEGEGGMTRALVGGILSQR